MPDHFKSPLTLYVLWHPKFTDGKKLADRLFNTLSRNVNDPFARMIGIPVYYRSHPAGSGGEAPAPILLDESDYNAIVVFVDSWMLLSGDWKEYVNDLLAKMEADPDKTRVFPMANDFNSFKSKELGATNYIRLFEADEKDDAGSAGAETGGSEMQAAPAPKAKPSSGNNASGAIDAGSGVSLTVNQPAGPGSGVNINITINAGEASAPASASVEPVRSAASADSNAAVSAMEPTATEESSGAEQILERRGNLMISKLVHELCRLILSQPQVTDAGTTTSAKPVNLFLSHAKADGAEIAKDIKRYIEDDSSMKTFFDANDIAPGYRFSDELKGAIENSALICIQTDYYATREWCLFEVITAKRFDRPVVVLNAVKEREPRSFPYIGNVPTMRWNPDDTSSVRKAVDLALFEVLANTYNHLFLKALLKLYAAPKGTHPVGRPPELFTILRLRQEAELHGEIAGVPPGTRYILYPDPPLGNEEILLLQELGPEMRFITPTMLPILEHQLKTS